MAYEKTGEKWEDWEVEILRKEYPYAPLNVLAEKLKRTEKSISNKASILKLKKKTKYRRGGDTRGLSWSDEEIEKLKRYYPTATKEELLKLFPNRNLTAIMAKAEGLDIYRRVPQWLDTSNINELSETDKAYLAGLIDGEGSIAIIKNHVSK